MVENSSGITDEEPPLDFTHLGSEFSITEPGNKTGLSNSTDSLKSFENHEESESETTQTTEHDSLRGRSGFGSFFTGHKQFRKFEISTWTVCFCFYHTMS